MWLGNTLCLRLLLMYLARNLSRDLIIYFFTMVCGCFLLFIIWLWCHLACLILWFLFLLLGLSDPLLTSNRLLLTVRLVVSCLIRRRYRMGWICLLIWRRLFKGWMGLCNRLLMVLGYLWCYLCGNWSLIWSFILIMWCLLISYLMRSRILSWVDCLLLTSLLSCLLLLGIWLCLFCLLLWLYWLLRILCLCLSIQSTIPPCIASISRICWLFLDKIKLLRCCPEQS